MTPALTEFTTQLLDFWFGGRNTREPGTMRREWFTKSEAFDATIRDAFLPAWEAEAAGMPATDWGDSPAAGCARIVLLDQFPRNMFRRDARSFATDPMALALAKKMVDEGADRRLPTQWHRMFCYLPFEHAESPVEQERSVALSTALRDETDGKVDVVTWAVKHQAVIARFGRFPHRNAALGRTSTPEEEQFLREPGARF